MGDGRSVHARRLATGNDHGETASIAQLPERLSGPEPCQGPLVIKRWSMPPSRWVSMSSTGHGAAMPRGRAAAARVTMSLYY
jgi:hypothetical protein